MVIILIGSVLEYTVKVGNFWETTPIFINLFYILCGVAAILFLISIIQLIRQIGHYGGVSSISTALTYVLIGSTTFLLSAFFISLFFVNDYRPDEVTIDELDVQVVDYSIENIGACMFNICDRGLFIETDDGVGEELAFYFDHHESTTNINKIATRIDNALLNNGVANITIPPGTVIESQMKYRGEKYINIRYADGLEIK